MIAMPMGDEAHWLRTGRPVGRIPRGEVRASVVREVDYDRALTVGQVNGGVSEHRYRQFIGNGDGWKDSDEHHGQCETHVHPPLTVTSGEHRRLSCGQAHPCHARPSLDLTHESATLWDVALRGCTPRPLPRRQPPGRTARTESG